MCASGIQSDEQTSADGQKHSEWLGSVLKEIETIKVGMTRSDLTAVFNPEAGPPARQERTYIHKRCPFIRIDVRFAAVGNEKDNTFERKEDKITWMSRPYLHSPPGNKCSGGSKYVPVRGAFTSAKRGFKFSGIVYREVAPYGRQYYPDGILGDVDYIRLYCSPSYQNYVSTNESRAVKKDVRNVKLRDIKSLEVGPTPKDQEPSYGSGPWAVVTLRNGEKFHGHFIGGGNGDYNIYVWIEGEEPREEEVLLDYEMESGRFDFE
jgi:hypothetical protein